jgi:hypothetical protein
LVWLAWKFVRDARPVSRSLPGATPDLGSEDLLEELLSDSAVEFAPGLADSLQADSPPVAADYIMLPADASGPPRWAIYLLLLEKAGCRPKTYVGSGTDRVSGFASRWKDYDLKLNLPRYVQEAVDDGYAITHKGLLCWSPIPPRTQILHVRHLFLILENVFSIVLGAMKAENPNMPRICPWPTEAFEYDGCCSHHAYYEGLRASNSDRMTPEQLTAWEAEKKLRKNRRQLNYVNENKQRNLAEWQARRRVWQSRLDPIKLVDSARRAQEKNRALRKYACNTCDMAFPSKMDLDVHLQSRRHIQKATGAKPLLLPGSDARRRANNLAARKYYCAPCDHAFATQQALDNHNKTLKHLRVLIAAGGPSTGGAFVEAGEATIGGYSTETDATPIGGASVEAWEAMRAAKRDENAKRKAAAIDSKRFYCKLCDYVGGTAIGLVIHKTSQRHKEAVAAAGADYASDPDTKADPVAKRKAAKLAENRYRKIKSDANVAEKKFYCAICDYAAGKQRYLLLHLSGPRHKKKAAAAGRGVSAMASAEDDDEQNVFGDASGNVFGGAEDDAEGNVFGDAEDDAEDEAESNIKMNVDVAASLS